MADIDMIPRSYRERLRVRRTLYVYGAVLGLLLVAGGAASAVLRWRLAVETPQLDAARAGALRTDTLRTHLASAQTRKDTLAEGVDALAALRGAGEVEALATLLNGVLNDKVWFKKLRFARTQELLQGTAPSPLPAGTVQVRTPGSGAVQAWRLGSHIEIEGRALDNPAMTAFLGALAAHPALGKVHFLNSSTATPEEGGAVAFSATGSLVKRKETP